MRGVAFSEFRCVPGRSVDRNSFCHGNTEAQKNTNYFLLIRKCTTIQIMIILTKKF